ncbi:hypothetical protein Ahy_A03g016163 [Arachis hypogaea]|uniref:NmrA-like domain-containing protein n=1 Tax=Arachis hypogaea TaxID=3818 RepID=A0A445E2M0_ARAHY|nr:hypothetical protein Ahy_A03g016163 [Arachis hypogaea]
MSVTTGNVVCVTGASGYIASWIVNFLLQRGYTVRATVRDPSDPKKVEHLLKLNGAKERLHLFKADLLEEGSFDSAIEGCDGVFHTASPVLLHVVKDPEVLTIFLACFAFSKEQHDSICQRHIDYEHSQNLRPLI